MAFERSQVKQLELSLWSVLRSATEDPSAAEFSTIWQALDRALLDLSVTSQLEMSSRAIAEVADIFEVQAGLIFELLDATVTSDGPIMGSDAFDRYVRQSMDINFDDYIEKLEPLERSPRSDGSRPQNDEFYSQVQSVDKTTLIESLHEEIIVLDTLSDAAVQESVIAVAHGEDVSEWLAIIRSYLSKQEKTIEFQYLLTQLDLQWVELWLGLLLGGYELGRTSKSFQIPEDFYAVSGLLIKL